MLIGVDSYDHKDLDSLSAVYNNLTQLRTMLMDKSIWGISLPAPGGAEPGHVG